jgi:hypothetical protein
MIKENAAELTPTEIAVYAELTCYANADGVAYPSEMRMSKDLNIGEEKLRKALNGLKNKNKITIQRGKFNTYTLLENVETDFSKLSKAVMCDPNLTLTAKLLYIFHTVYADFKDIDYTEGGRTFPKRNHIKNVLGINSDTTYYKHFNLLKKYGYVEVFQRYENGKLGVNDYILTKNPEKSVENEDIQKGKRTIAYGEKDEKGKFHPVNIVTYVCDGVKKVVEKAKNFVTKTIEKISQKTKKTVTPKQPFSLTKNSDLVSQIRQNTDVDGLVRFYQKLDYTDKVELARTAFSTMCECIEQNKKQKVCGKYVSAEEIKTAFLKVDWTIFDNVISKVYNQIKLGEEEIMNLKGYFIAAIYNTAMNCDFLRKSN